jgi:hypothetical protein
MTDRKKALYAQDDAGVTVPQSEGEAASTPTDAIQDADEASPLAGPEAPTEVTEFGLDEQEPEQPVEATEFGPWDGRDSQPAESSSDDPELLERTDPLKGTVEAQIAAAEAEPGGQPT